MYGDLDEQEVDATLRDVETVVAVLDAHGIPSALIGAAALAVHGTPRASADIDLGPLSRSRSNQQLEPPPSPSVGDSGASPGRALLGHPTKVRGEATRRDIEGATHRSLRAW
ncbi:MAG: hypothetical protein D6776_08145 [Planctomycetota bacterium]|nr:MAG: hypothetical protein D6776_08145 [Planctomycetota bacterium]